MDIEEKIAYLKGLADGMAVENTNEGKLIVKMIEVLGEIVEELDELDDAQEEMAEMIEALDEDLGEVESLLGMECSGDCATCDDDCCGCDFADECDCEECDCDCEGDCEDCECADCDEAACECTVCKNDEVVEIEAE